MLTMTPAHNFVRYRGLGAGKDGGPSVPQDVADLQNTLIKIAKLTGDPTYNPRSSGGTMNMGTVVATFNCYRNLGAQLPILGDLFDKINSLVSLLESISGAGYLVSKLLDPGQVDNFLDQIAAIGGQEAVGYVADIRKSQGFVADNAEEINFGLNLITLFASLPEAGLATEVPTDRGAGAAAGMFTVYDPGMDLWRVFKPWVTPKSAAIKSTFAFKPPAAPAAPAVVTPTVATITRTGSPLSPTSIQAVLDAKATASFGGACCFGQDSAGKIEVQELTPVAEQPAVPVLSIEEAEAKYNIQITRKAWYKAWQTWAVVGGLLAVGGGATYVVRRRKRVG